MEIKNISNNEVAGTADFEAKRLAMRQHERSIMDTPDSDEFQLVSLGKN